MSPFFLWYTSVRHNATFFNSFWRPFLAFVVSYTLEIFFFGLLQDYFCFSSHGGNLYVKMMNETLFLILSLKTQSLSVDPGHHFTLDNNSPKIFDFLASLHFSGFRYYSYGFFSYDSRHGEFFRFAIFKTQFSYTIISQ